MIAIFKRFFFKEFDIDNSDFDEKEADESSEEKEEEKIEINGMTIIQKGQYSKCPRCLKFIKSTFIIRHIKLHDSKPEKATCPENCGLSFAKINNMFRHLKNVHKSKEPFVCKYCSQRFSKSKMLTQHLAKHRAEKRSRNLDADSDEDSKKFVCEFPDCGKSYGKKHHLKVLKRNLAIELVTHTKKNL